MRQKLFTIAAVAVALAGLTLFAIENTLSMLPEINTFPAPQAVLGPNNVAAIATIVSQQNANNASLRASINLGGVSAPVACGASCSPTSGLILLNQGAGSTVTLPTAAATGNIIRMRITATTTSAAEKVLLTTTSNTIIGTAIGWTGSTPIVFAGNAGTYHSLQMPYAGSQPSGGFIGDTITCTDISATTWACDVVYEGGTTPTTPYSTSTT